MAQVQGHCDDEFEGLRHLMKDFIHSDQELGASLTVNIDGKNVIDIWGGYRDEAKTRLWDRDTIVNVWSVTKAISSLAVFILVDRGLLNFNEKVARYWPEFAANGKQDVEVRHIISHTSGVPAWEKPITLEDIYDIDESTARLAAQAPWWAPGTASGYHSLTHGHLIAELVRRVTGKSLKQFIAEDIAAPLEADFQIGVPEKDYHRTAQIIPPPLPSSPRPAPSPGSVMERAMNAPAIKAEVSETTGWRNAQVAAAGGYGNSRSITSIMSILSLSGTINGLRFLSPETIQKIFEEQANGTDLVIGAKVRFGTGFSLPAKDTIFDWVPTDGHICGWGGWGGSMVLMDIDRRMTISYAMNKMQNVGLGSPNTKAYIAAVYKVLGVTL